MHLIGCDFHTRFQQMAMMDCQSGEIIERRLDHEAGEARKFYVALPGPARIGMEATGCTQWVERMLAEQALYEYLTFILKLYDAQPVALRARQPGKLSCGQPRDSPRGYRWTVMRKRLPKWGHSSIATATSRSGRWPNKSASLELTAGLAISSSVW